MSFGTNLYSLRKDRQLSQEALAAELNTTRQAVSKWENDQGFPEMEKLLMLSSFFGVTVDALLKGPGGEGEGGDAIGYYAGSESVEGFLAHARRTAGSIGLGVLSIFMSGAPFLLFPWAPVLCTISAAMLVIAGIGCIVAVCLRENPHPKITREPLLIDSKYLAELRSGYASLKKKYLILLVGGIGLGVMGLAFTVILEEVLHLRESGYHAVPLFLFSAGACGSIYAAAVMWAYGVVTNNSAHLAKRQAGKRPVGFWRIVGIFCACIAALALLYRITGGSGHIARWIDKLISKL